MCGVGLLANLGFDFRSLTLVEVDFVLEGDRNPMHELNTVSPAFTCGLPFSEYVCERIKSMLNGGMA